MNPLSQLTERERRDQRGRSARGRPTLGSALRDERFREDVGTNALNALAGIPAGVLGMPVDLMTMAMRPFGYSVPQEQVVGSSDWIGRKAGADPGNPAFIAGQFASPDPVDAVKLAGLLDPNALMALGGMTAYHGTPHRFAPEPDAPLGKFRLDKIGTGEGAQAYGHGIYLAESPDVAGGYARVLSNRDAQGYADAHLNAQSQVARMGGDPEWAAEVLSDSLTRLPPDDPNYDRISKTLEMIKSGAYKEPLPNPGSLYTVDLPDEQIEKMLDWDKPLSEQPESVRKAFAGVRERRLEKMQSRRGIYTSPPEKILAEQYMGAWYDDLASELGGQQAASEYLRANGIPGIRYLDGSSRKAGEGTRNFVLFDPEIAKITGVE